LIDFGSYGITLKHYFSALVQIGTSERMRDQILDATERLLGVWATKKPRWTTSPSKPTLVVEPSTYTSQAKKPWRSPRSTESSTGLLDRLDKLARAELSWEERLRRMLAERVLFRFDSVRGYFTALTKSSVRCVLLIWLVGPSISREKPPFLRACLPAGTPRVSSRSTIPSCVLKCSCWPRTPVAIGPEYPRIGRRAKLKLGLRALRRCSSRVS